MVTTEPTYFWINGVRFRYVEGTENAYPLFSNRAEAEAYAYGERVTSGTTELRSTAQPHISKVRPTFGRKKYR